VYDNFRSLSDRHQTHKYIVCQNAADGMVHVVTTGPERLSNQNMILAHGIGTWKVDVKFMDLNVRHFSEFRQHSLIIPPLLK
jgi:hypothetical protein